MRGRTACRCHDVVRNMEGHPFGNLATSARWRAPKRPMAFRPRLATGLALSVDDTEGWC
jgi:hypothetical protein